MPFNVSIIHRFKQVLRFRHYICFPFVSDNGELRPTWRGEQKGFEGKQKYVRIHIDVISRNWVFNVFPFSANILLKQIQIMFLMLSPCFNRRYPYWKPCGHLVNIKRVKKVAVAGVPSCQLLLTKVNWRGQNCGWKVL